MKTFLSVFFAILAAAAVIGIIGSFDKLNHMRAQTVVLRAEADRAKAATDQIDEMRRSLDTTAPPPSTEDLLGQWEKAKEGCKVRIKEESGERAIEWERALVMVLQTKPGGAPLTAQEKNDLVSVKAELAKAKTDSAH